MCEPVFETLRTDHSNNTIQITIYSYNLRGIKIQNDKRCKDKTDTKTKTTSYIKYVNFTSSIFFKVILQSCIQCLFSINIFPAMFAFFLFS